MTDHEPTDSAREMYDAIVRGAGTEIVHSREVLCPFSTALGGRVFLRSTPNSSAKLRHDTWTLVTMDNVMRLTYVVDTKTELPTRAITPTLSIATLAGVLIADIRSEELAPSEDHDPVPVILKLAIAFDIL